MEATRRSKKGALPNVIIIGAAKCGTTSLRCYLKLHPAIAMTRDTESRPLAESLRGLDGRDRAPAAVRRRIGDRIYRPFTHRIEPPVLDERTCERLREFLAPDVARLRVLTGLAFAAWSL